MESLIKKLRNGEGNYLLASPSGQQPLDPSIINSLNFFFLCISLLIL